ncbi:hypothetical protein [Teredinibacter sp. KSP-S5-2]|uniref:hypothetical protein n=1 Tax=Teredinibacter sp. KSP-S5-2 TaxID=3034506 RepID=UPI002934F771|nr:hypothetical protein [Teredinibacter sp. KSP-S5-2]WNO10317.1 hypothetical protein P5V12_03935 [Teredinibacter sp. KSP-S5-2]
MNVFLFSCLFFFSQVAFSVSQSVPSDRSVSLLVAYGDIVVVQFSPSFENTQNCSSSSQVTAQLDLNEDPHKALYSTLLMAFASGKKVGFGIEGCSGQYPKIYRVDVKS